MDSYNAIFSVSTSDIFSKSAFKIINYKVFLHKTL